MLFSGLSLLSCVLEIVYPNSSVRSTCCFQFRPIGLRAGDLRARGSRECSARKNIGSPLRRVNKILYFSGFVSECVLFNPLDYGKRRELHWRCGATLASFRRSEGRFGRRAKMEGSPSCVFTLLAVVRIECDSAEKFTKALKFLTLERRAAYISGRAQHKLMAYMLEEAHCQSRVWQAQSRASASP